MTTPGDACGRVFGCIVKSRWDRGLPFDSLTVAEHALTLKSPWRSAVEIARADVSEIYVERIRVPFVVATVLYICPTPLVWTYAFNPFHGGHAARLLRDCGWDVTVGRAVTPRSLLRREVPPLHPADRP